MCQPPFTIPLSHSHSSGSSLSVSESVGVWRCYYLIVQGVFFNWYPPKNHKYGKKLKYQNWYPPKIHKYGKKLKYQNWYPPSNSQVSELVPPPQMHNYDAAQKDIDFQVIIMGICMP